MAMRKGLSFHAFANRAGGLSRPAARSGDGMRGCGRPSRFRQTSDAIAPCAFSAQAWREAWFRVIRNLGYGDFGGDGRHP